MSRVGHPGRFLTIGLLGRALEQKGEAARKGPGTEFRILIDRDCQDDSRTLLESEFFDEGLL